MADTSNRLAGIANFSIDGVPYMLRGKATYRVGAVIRETISGQDGVHGYKEMPQPGEIKLDLTDSDGLSVAALNAITNSTLVLGLANGKTIVGSKMWSVDAQEVDTEDAKLSVTFQSRNGGVTEQ